MVYRDPMWLRDYTENQLLEELARRANARGTKKPDHWCHDCAHFVAWFDRVPAPRKDCPDNYNPCAKGHEMKFIVPEEITDEYGFYRSVCADRGAKDDAHEIANSNLVG